MTLEEWITFIKSPISGDRAHAADDVPDSINSDIAVSHLLSCLDDENSLVRTCAVSSLRNYPSDLVLARLKQLLPNETDELTKRYIILAIADMGYKEELQILMLEANKENSSHLSLPIYVGMYLCISNIVKKEISFCLFDKQTSYNTKETSIAFIELINDRILEIENFFQSQLTDFLSNKLIDKKRGLISKVEELLSELNNS
jgi:hypothetical protein